MIDIPQKKSKIISFIETNGPSLPVRIAKAIEMDPVFASAILSELLNTKQIKMSHMKIGASSLYILPGQEQKLEDFTEHLNPIEKGAYLKLKEKKILIHENEEPAIRVALQNIKDFATPFKFQEKIMWRYVFTPDEEIEDILTPKKKDTLDTNGCAERRPNKIENILTKPEEKKVEKIIPRVEVYSKKNIIFDKNLPTDTEKTNNEFLSEVKEFLKNKDIEFLEEIQSEKKEVVAKVNMKSKLGNINFLLIAKNKQTTSKEEIAAAIQRAIYNKMPCLLVIRKRPSKNLEKIIEENHLIKLEIID